MWLINAVLMFSYINFIFTPWHRSQKYGFSLFHGANLLDFFTFAFMDDPLKSLKTHEKIKRDSAERRLINVKRDIIDRYM